MKAINSVNILGRITRDLELKKFNSGTSVLQFSVAIDRGMSKEKKEEAQAQGRPTSDFPNCKAVGKTAENIAKYFKKGSLIAIEASVETGSYDHKDGHKVYTTDLFVQKFHFCGESKNNGNGGAMAGGGSGDGMGNYNPDFESMEDESEIPF